MTICLSFLFVGLTQSLISLWIILSPLFFYFASLWYFEKYLLSGFEIPFFYVKRIFSITFTSCCIMFQLLILEVFHILSLNLRFWIWRLDLILVIALEYFLIPVALVHTWLAEKRNSSFQNIFEVEIDPGFQERPIFGKDIKVKRSINFIIKHYFKSLKITKGEYICDLILLPSLWFIFYWWANLLLDPPLHLSFNFLLEPLLAYIGACGITIISALSAYGCIQLPYQKLVAIYFPISERDIIETQLRLKQTSSMLEEFPCDASLSLPYRFAKKTEPSTTDYSPNFTSATNSNSPLKNPTKPSQHTLSFSKTNISNNSDKREHVEALLKLEFEYKESLKALMQRKFYQQNTTRLTAFLTLILCTYRFLTATLNVIFSRVSSVDPTTKFLNFVFSMFSETPVEDSKFWIPYTSIIVMGLIIILSVRSFIQKSIGFFQSYSASVSTQTLALILTEFMGLYFSACVLLIRVYLPLEGRASLSKMIGENLSFSKLQFLSDGIFILSCTIFLIITLSSHNIKESKLKIG